MITYHTEKRGDNTPNKFPPLHEEERQMHPTAPQIVGRFWFRRSAEQ
jgi:hypothetical protein